MTLSRWSHVALAFCWSHVRRQSMSPCRRSVAETCRGPHSLSGTIRRFSSADQRPRSRHGSVDYIVDHICEPMPSTGSHLPNYVARCKMAAKHRSDVRSQGPGRTRPSASTSGSKEMIAHRWERNLKDVGFGLMTGGGASTRAAFRRTGPVPLLSSASAG